MKKNSKNKKVKSIRTSGAIKSAVKAKKQVGSALDVALLNAYDLMQRFLLDTSFLVVGEAGRALYEKRPLEGVGIECVLHAREVTPELYKLLSDRRDNWVQGIITEMTEDKGFTYLVGQVPVTFTFLTKTYSFFQNPDVRPYGPEWYRIPNPFAEYWKARFDLR